MSLKYGVFCVLLFFIVIFVGVRNYDTWTHPVESSPEKRVGKKPETKTEVPSIVTSTKGASSIESYIFIAEKNIFSRERKEFPLPLASAATKKPVVRPQIILYGVTILGDYQYASLVNPGRPLKKGEREMITLKQGEQIGEYKLVKILPDRIRLEAAEDSFEVLLYDPAVPKKRSDIKTATKKPATITSTAPASVPVSAQAPETTPFPVPFPIPSSVPNEKPREPSQERVSPTPLPSPMTPTAPPVSPGRTRRPPYPPTRTPIQQGGS